LVYRRKSHFERTLGLTARLSGHLRHLYQPPVELTRM
jgi:hypothetical protein